MDSTARAGAMLCALAPSVAQRAAPEISRERLRADLEFLTSARLEGRASLTPGAAAAAQFIAAELGKAGVRPASVDSSLQPFDLQPVRLDRDRTLIVVRRPGEEALERRSQDEGSSCDENDSSGARTRQKRPQA